MGGKKWLVGSALVSAVVALVLILVNLTWVSLPVGYKYGMVFDAGSTHTALFLYKWQEDKQNSTGLVTQVMVCDVDGPGISSYANNPPAAGQSLKVCLDTAAAAVPRENQREAPVYLGATAGMRLLNITSPSQSDQVLAEVAKFIQLYPFDFRGARIISGDEEGAYGWVTINYLLQSFIKCTFEGKWKLPTSAKTLGAMDLGGASTQLTFTPAVPIKDKNYESNFTLYGNKYNVYTHSYLCYGKEQAMKKVQANLIQAFSAFFYTFDILKLTPKASLSVTLDTISKFCQKPWAQLKAEYPTEKEDRLRDYCALGFYITTLLVDGYKFNSTSWDNIQFQKTADYTDVGWTLGYMLNLTNLIPSTSPSLVRGHGPGEWTASVIFTVFSIFLCLLAFCVQCLESRQMSSE
ncbi:ectonucleoside triphosphate diphosphohydrolase 8-like isoform X2 [Erpetoichthys calabaricus]|uniref:ectonucleoside triphosphate diphosphohydrolase 8-like isoform X2 n=1 Tax=Erpetoichthys calabaricus TaxID=27687 RepID=UPI002234B92A|nr:ectonucleoside triphosphate diphosphohydrolase 8-like isoform X2 [Erpetoichthys calabaricus]